MRELKTLKDLNREDYIDDFNTCSTDELKQEVIKWIKYCKANFIFCNRDCPYYGLMEFWMERFNIIEEDLK